MGLVYSSWARKVVAFVIVVISSTTYAGLRQRSAFMSLLIY